MKNQPFVRADLPDAQAEWLATLLREAGISVVKTGPNVHFPGLGSETYSRIEIPADQLDRAREALAAAKKAGTDLSSCELPWQET